MKRHSGLVRECERDSTKAYRTTLTLSTATHQVDTAPPPLLPPTKDLNAHSVADNLTAADRFRGLLDDGDDGDKNEGWYSWKGELAAHQLAQQRVLGAQHPWSLSSLYNVGSSEKEDDHSQSSDAEDEPGSSPPTTALFREAGCDITLPQFAGDTFFPHIPRLALDPTLPNMAAEHPARVWNVLLHSLPPDLQPMVQWEYEEVTLLGQIDADFIAHLTLILPPSHPVITAHRLFKVLPDDRYSPEYREVVKLLGGSKTWSGAPKKLKVDAQNHALAACIADDALKWIYSPNVPTAEEDEYNSDGDSVREVVKNPDVIDVDDDDDDDNDPENNHEGIGKLLAMINNARSTWTSSHSSSLSSCSPPPVTRTKVPRQSSDYLQQSSLFQKNAQQAPPAVRRPRSVPGADCATGGQISHNPAESVANNGTQHDWQARLEDFCHASGLLSPTYSQLILKHRGHATKFLGQVTVDGEVFTGGVPTASLKEARQQVAWMVYTGHFGQRGALPCASAASSPRARFIISVQSTQSSSSFHRIS
ncbi:uncharacterized protein LOC62_06G007958 [Vanrija pseudolonga]|uniref:DRBM domain-containing protein n=1 Tax=Vanrija pseudolonga TaxID=143232 RepID=A0AAF0YG80_9TREE|nr:hypothetical protein LOC62_06G007958 [Vanrija pseudolonga]